MFVGGGGGGGSNFPKIFDKKKRGERTEGFDCSFPSAEV